MIFTLGTAWLYVSHVIMIKCRKYLSFHVSERIVSQIKVMTAQETSISCVVMLQQRHTQTHHFTNKNYISHQRLWYDVIISLKTHTESRWTSGLTSVLVPCPLGRWFVGWWLLESKHWTSRSSRRPGRCLSPSSCECVAEWVKATFPVR